MGAARGTEPVVPLRHRAGVRLAGLRCWELYAYAQAKTNRAVEVFANIVSVMGVDPFARRLIAKIFPELTKATIRELGEFTGGRHDSGC